MKKILLPVFIIAYSLFFAEWFLRFLDPQPLLPRYIQAGEHGIRENIRNARYRHSTPEIEVVMQTNSLGMRDDRNFSIEKPEGVCRVAIFGDSFFMGYEVHLEDSFAIQLQSQLREGGKNCEVLNFAVSGFGTAESLITLKKNALQFSPDYVVLEWHLTDPDDNSRSGLFELTETGELQATGNSYLPGVKLREQLMQYSLYRWAIEYSHLYSVAREKLAGNIKELLLFINRIGSQQETATTDDPVLLVEENAREPKAGINEKLVNGFCQTAQSQGAQCLVVDLPSQHFDGSLVSGYDLLATGFVQTDGLLSPIGLMEKARDEGLSLFRKKGHFHFTELGYKLSAKVVADHILGQ